MDVTSPEGEQRYAALVRAIYLEKTVKM